MRAATVALIVLGCLAGCGQSKSNVALGIQTRPSPTVLRFSDTVSPSLSQEIEVAWTAYLIAKIVDRHPGSSKESSSDYDIALLLEVSRHNEKVMLKAIEFFKAGGVGRDSDEPDVVIYYDYYNVEAAMDMIKGMKLALPHYETTGHASYMWPLTIEDGRIVFEGMWPKYRGGIWLDPFEPAYFWDIGTSSIYEIEKREYGERDLDEFSKQFLKPKKRAGLWNQFIDRKNS